MKNLFIKQLSSVRSHNLVIQVIKEKYNMTGLQVRKAFTKEERRKKASLLLNVKGCCL